MSAGAGNVSGMRATSESTIVIDLIKSIVDVGELTKLVVKCGMDADISRVVDEMGPHTRLVAHRAGAEWFETEIADLMLVYSFVRSKSLNELFDDVRRELEDRHAPFDKAIQDVMEIGGGPEHEGHEHDQ